MPRYPVKAEAVAASTVHGFDRDAYLEVLKNPSATCRGLFREVVRRTQRHLDGIETLVIQSARFQLVRLQSAGIAGTEWTVQLAARKLLSASQLAVQPETLSWLFRDLGRDGFIHVRDDSIHIVDEAALQRLPR